MTYCKPEIAILGEAVQLINELGKYAGVIFEGVDFYYSPLYDLDD